MFLLIYSIQKCYHGYIWFQTSWFKQNSMYRAVFPSGTASVCRWIYISIHIYYNLRQDYPKKRRHDYNMVIYL